MSIIHADCMYRDWQITKANAIWGLQHLKFNHTVRTLVVILFVIARLKVILQGCKQ